MLCILEEKARYTVEKARLETKLPPLYCCEADKKILSTVSDYNYPMQMQTIYVFKYVINRLYYSCIHLRYPKQI